MSNGRWRLDEDNGIKLTSLKDVHVDGIVRVVICFRKDKKRQRKPASNSFLFVRVCSGNGVIVTKQKRSQDIIKSRAGSETWKSPCKRMVKQDREQIGGAGVVFVPAAQTDTRRSGRRDFRVLWPAAFNRCRAGPSATLWSRAPALDF